MSESFKQLFFDKTKVTENKLPISQRKESLERESEQEKSLGGLRGSLKKIRETAGAIPESERGSNNENLEVLTPEQEESLAKLKKRAEEAVK